MPFPVYSAKLLSVAGLSTTASDTVLPGWTWVVKHIDLVFHSGPAGAIAYVKAEIGQFVWYVTTPSTSANYLYYDGRIVLTGGQTLLFGTTGVIDITASGYAFPPGG